MLEMVRTARKKGLTTPVLFMGYYNPILRYGQSQLLTDCIDAGVNGFIIVDLPPEEAVRFRNGCTSSGSVSLPVPRFFPPSVPPNDISPFPIERLQHLS